MAFPYLLLAAQAAGVASSIYGNEQQNRIGKYGARLDQQSMQLRMEQETLAATQETLQDLTNLRETLASQRAIFAARGQNPGQGTAKAIENKSISAFGAEQQARDINKTFRKSYLESMGRLKRVESEGLRAARGVQLLGQSLNMVDFGSLYGGMNTSTEDAKTKTKSK